MLQDPEIAFAFLDQLFRSSDGDPEMAEDLWQVGTSVGLDSLRAQQICDALAAEGLVSYGSPSGHVNLTPFGASAVLQAHEHPEQGSLFFPALADFSTPIGMLIQDGSLGGDTLRALSSQLAGCLSALDGNWLERADLEQLVEDLDMALWCAQAFPEGTLEELEDVAVLLR